MADKPILFSTPMVRALLDGRKTQTRRVITERNTMFNGDRWPKGLKLADCDLSSAFVDPGPSPSGNPGPYLKVQWPYGRMLSGVEGDNEMLMARLYPITRPSDRLWVRETWAPLSALTHSDPGTQALADGGFYRADEGTVDGEISKWKPSIFMPRWASRITLIVTDVRVERLQDISEADAKAEGVSDEFTDYEFYGQSQPYRFGYSSLWNLINGEGGWQANPWVAAYTFNVILKNIDEVA